MSENPFTAVEKHQGQIAVAQTRAAQEVQASMVIAKKFPRNQEEAIERIRRSCQRRSLAEAAQYAYPRGGTQVVGPSIRLAECIAQNWGNLDFGIVELEQRNGESTVLAYAWDTETNARSSKTFQVKHERKAHGKLTSLDDPRDIYEMVANQGARRLRSCILSVIPGDVVDIAIEQCDATLKTNKEPLIDRVRKMAAAFAEFGVTVPLLEKRLGHKLDATIEQELVTLRKIYTSLKDGMAKREDFFAVETVLPPKPPVSSQSEQQGNDTDDEAAEAAAGLAPVPPPEPAKAAARGRKAKEPPPAPAAPPPAPELQPIDVSHLDPTGKAFTGRVLMEMTKAMVDADIGEEVLMQFCVDEGLATEKQTELSHMATKKLLEICSRWPDVVKQIKGE